MNRSNVEIRKTENQSKFIQDRITNVEKHFGDLCTHFGAISRKTSKLRDKGDELARSLMQYAEEENLNPSMKDALTEFSENLSAVQDYRETEVKRIEAKVVEPLSLYETTCKHAKGDLKQAFAARDREMKTQKKLENVKDKNPSDRHTISQAETELQKAAVDASWSNKHLEEMMDNFEKKKLVDLKKVLQEFVNIELLFHAKALEMYTRCFHSLERMSEDDDLEQFRNSLRPNSTQSRLDMQQRASSTRSLNTTDQSRGTPGQHRRHSDTPAPRPSSNAYNGRNSQVTKKVHVRHFNVKQYDDYEDDDDDDDYESEDEYENKFQARPQNPRSQPTRSPAPQPQSRRK